MRANSETVSGAQREPDELQRRLDHIDGPCGGYKDAVSKALHGIASDAIAALRRLQAAQRAYALRMKSGHWVGIWNDRATAEHMRSRYRDGDKYEIVEFPQAAQREPVAWQWRYQHPVSGWTPWKEVKCEDYAAQYFRTAQLKHGALAYECRPLFAGETK